MIEERVSTLEAEVKMLQSQVDTLQTQNAAQNANVLERINGIDEKLNKAQGFVGGVIFLTVGLYYGLLMFKEWFVKKLGG